MHPFAVARSKSAGYEVENSVRLNDNDSAYMSWTPGGASDSDRVFTVSFWFKPGNISDNGDFIFQEHTTAGRDCLRISRLAGDALYIQCETAAGNIVQRTTTQVFRDPTSWYHICVQIDGSDASSGSCVLEVNGATVSDFSAETNPSATTDLAFFNTTRAVHIGAFARSYSGNYLDGYLSQFVVIDGTNLDATSFGEFDDEGEWRPKEIDVTFGANGFLQTYSVAPGTGNGAGTDVSGNTNHFTDSGLTAADQVSDSPTNNFCTIASNSEPLHAGSGVWAVANGNTEAGLASGTGDMHYRTTMQVSEGEWYWEDTVGTQGAWGDMFGILEINTGGLYSVHNYNGSLNADTTTNSTSGGAQGYGSGLSSGDTVCNHLDLESGEYSMRVNDGSWREQLTGMSGAWAPMIGMNNQTASFQGNWGTSPRGSGGNADDNGYGDFDYAPPTNALSLCTANMTALTFDPAEHHQVELVNHDGSSTSFTLGWDADVYDTLFIIKNRDSSEEWFWVDGLNGYNKYYRTSTVGDTQQTDANIISVSGTTITLGSTLAADNYIIECHRAGAAGGASNTDGTITTTVSANSTTQFSIVNYTGTGVNATVGHGLSGADVVMAFANAAETSICGHTGAGWTGTLRLDATSVQSTDATVWQDTAPSSTVVTIGTYQSVNKSSTAITLYCFKAVEGYSAFPTWEGNASLDGPCVISGISPKSVTTKGIDGVSDWVHYSSAINPYNEASISISYNSASGENTSTTLSDIDFLSNGHKHREDDSDSNPSSTMIGMVFGTPTVNKSETPAKAR